MLPFRSVRDEKTGEEVLEVSLKGPHLLHDPLLNKGSAFSEEERRELGLMGLVPPHQSDMKEQLVRFYENYQRKETDLERYIDLISLQDTNETLFYRLLQEHITEMMPIIYTPVVGLACQNYSHIYRRSRGLYISYPLKDEMETLLSNAPNPDVEVIVVTDGERILGLGDLGIGGMGIPVGKLSLYTLCAAIHPASTLPILLDVGTNNTALLNDPLYLGWHHERVRGKDYDDFIEAFVAGITRRFPNVLLQWEDFSKNNAGRLLEKYHDRLCTFNDDIQGTGAVTLAGLLAAVEVAGTTLGNSRIVIFGAGSAAMGISHQILTAMVDEGLSRDEAKSRLWFLDSQGLVHSGRDDLEPAKRAYIQPLSRTDGWKLARSGRITLGDVVEHVHPTILIGTAAQPGIFTEGIVRTMAQHTKRPIIFPLSNPTSKSEAVPADLMAWTEGRALVATGSPFADVMYNGRTIPIGQCNNAYVFPGVGLGVIASGARRVTDSMFVAAARALSDFAPSRKNPAAALFPNLTMIREISRRVAFTVASEAQRLGLAPKSSPEELEKAIERKIWRPEYKRLRYRRGEPCHT